jgi:Ca-activated chloride channel homolog
LSVFELLWPWAFAALPLPWFIRRFAPPLVRHDAALRVPDIHRFEIAGVHAIPARTARRWPLLLAWLGWICLLGAVARPQYTGDPVTLPESGRDLMLAVDISGSMNTEDMQLDGAVTNRLAVVKRVVSDFIAKRSGDRVGLVLFGSNAYLQAPLTFDLATVEQLLQEAPIGIAGGKTAVGDAIALAVKRLRERPGESRVLVLLTDGANNVGEVPPDKAAELAAAEGVRVYTVGVGADELKLPGFFGEFGARIVNPSADLDEASLQHIADVTGGRYFRAKDTAELAKIYQLLDAIEPVKQDPREFRPVQSLFYLPLAGAWAAWLTVLLWGSMRNGYGMA